MNHPIFPGYTPVVGYLGLYTNHRTGQLAQLDPSQHAHQMDFTQQQPRPQLGMPQPSPPALNNTPNAHQQPPQYPQSGYQANFASPHQSRPHYHQQAPLAQQQPQYAPGPYPPLRQQQQIFSRTRRMPQPHEYSQTPFNAPDLPQAQFSQLPNMGTRQYGQLQAAPMQQRGAIQAHQIIDLTQDNDEFQDIPTLDNMNNPTHEHDEPQDIPTADIPTTTVPTASEAATKRKRKAFSPPATHDRPHQTPRTEAPAPVDDIDVRLFNAFKADPMMGPYVRANFPSLHEPPRSNPRPEG